MIPIIRCGKQSLFPGALFLAFSLLACDVFAQGVRVHAIWRDGASVSEAADVLIVTADVPDGARRIVRVDDRFEAGFEIVSPALTVIEFESDNSNRISIEAGARLRIADVTAAGERYRLRAGSVVFDVLRALSFFRVEFEDEFTALVHGTRFRVDGAVGEDGPRFSCEVLHGTLLVQRPELLSIAGSEKPLRVKTPVLLTAAGRRAATWTRADVEQVRSFANVQEVEAYAARKLDRANADAFDHALVSAQIAAAAGDKSRALELYAQAEQNIAPQSTDPRVGELYLKKGELLASAGRDEEALRDYGKAREQFNATYRRDANPEAARVLAREAEVHVKNQRIDLATERYQQAIQVESEAALGAETPRIRRNLKSIERLQHRAEPMQPSAIEQPARATDLRREESIRREN
jgi:tetratricopeptide (TPR) repeat protein